LSRGTFAPEASAPSLGDTQAISLAALRT